MKVQNVPRLVSLILLCSCMAACNQQQVPGANAATLPASSQATAAIPAAAPKPTPVPVCSSCGHVRSVTAIKQDGQASGAGAVIGGIVGGVAGRQVGGGSGRDIATVAGAIGGAVLGNEVEQNRNGSTSYEVVIDMEGGGQQVVNVADAGGLTPGAEVSVQGGRISLR
jgi:outer membrane lipoprotein SlyB